MSIAGVCATDIEIRATARLLQTPIFTWVRYNKTRWQWKRFAPGLSLQDTLLHTAVPSLYIQNTSSCQYDVVTSVMNDDDEGLSDSHETGNIYVPYIFHICNIYKEHILIILTYMNYIWNIY